MNPFKTGIISAVLAAVLAYPVLGAEEWKDLEKRAAEAFAGQRYAEAAEFGEQSLDAIGRELGPDHYYRGNAYATLAIYYYYAGDLKRAEEMFRSSIGILKKNGEEARSSLAGVYTSLANLYWREGRRDEEIPRLYKQSAVIYENLAEPNETGHILTLEFLTHYYERTGRVEDAKASEKNLRVAYAMLPDADYEKLASAFQSLTFAAQRNNDPDSADRFAKKAREIRDKIKQRPSA